MGIPLNVYPGDGFFGDEIFFIVQGILKIQGSLSVKKLIALLGISLH
jgi:hypothetical protein